MSDPQRYPLDWPIGEPRTREDRRIEGPFRVSFAQSRDELLRELELMGAGNVVISSNLELRRDGMPYSNTDKKLRDPGIAVYWTAKRDDDNSDRWVPFVMTCDRYTTVAQNLRAIGLSIAALRALERYGSKQIRNRAFSGFAALPADAGKSSWRAALGLDRTGLVTVEEVERAFKRAAMSAHPDRPGGSSQAMALLNQARQDALNELRGTA